MKPTVRFLSGIVWATALLMQAPASANQGEVGTVTVSQSAGNQWHTIETINDYSNPVIILGPPTENDPQPLAPRVRRVKSDEFEFQLDRWDYLPGAHGEETISYLVIEAGSYTLANGSRIQAGIMDGVSTGGFEDQLFPDDFSQIPAVLTQVVTRRDSSAVTVQVHNPRVDRFTLRLLVEEANPGHPDEKVAWIAIEPSSLLGVRKYIAGISDEKIGSDKKLLSFGLGGFQEDSPFFAQQRAFNDSDTATLRRNTIDFSSTPLFQQEEASVSSEKHHAKDFISFLVFQSPGTIPFTPNPPQAEDDSATIQPLGMISLDVLKNDQDVEEDLDPGTLELVDSPSHGTATVDPINGRIHYSNTEESTEPDSFSYIIKDSRGDSSDVATVEIRFSSSKRLSNTTLDLPEDIPFGSYKLVNAFPDIGFTKPVNMATPPGETKRLFVVEKEGKIKVIDDLNSPTPQAEVFMDISNRVSTLAERGLLGLAFHPDYENNRTFFIVYTDDIVPNPNPWTFGSTRHTILSRFQTSEQNPNSADMSSETILIRMIDRDPGHQAGDLEFGPDGYLYMSSGDEGTQNDTFKNAQTITKGFHSGILRFDVDKLPGNPEPNPHPYINTDNEGKAYYSVPADNPWVDATEFEGVPFGVDDVVRTEFYAVGFRNPWQMSFDPVTNDLWLGDVGRGAREEINRVVKGGNYQWAYKEGTVDGPKIDQMPEGFTGIPPIHDYSRSGTAAAVIGGIVYRGNKLTDLEGVYIFGDYQVNKIWALEIEDDEVEVEEIAYEGGITAFFADPSNGDPLITDFEGKIWRLVEDKAAAPEIPTNLSQTGAFADLATLTPNPGIVYYDPNVRFWSDHAKKSRWFSLPELDETITWHHSDPWEFPEGMVWIKHFDLELERGNPESSRRVETRFLVKTEDGSYGISYQWNEEETEAFLVPTEGADIDYEVQVGAETKTQSWRIPGRAECLQCHTSVAGDALSFNTRQLNNIGPMFGESVNQLKALETSGYFANAIQTPSSLPYFVNLEDPAFSLTERVRSYLAVNCVSCHQPGGTGLGSWDARPELSLEQTGIINGIAGNNGGNPNNRLIVPGKPDESIILSRMTGCCEFRRMPPLASSELDEEAIQIVTDWILSLDNTDAYQEWRTEQFGSDSSPEGEKDFDADQDQFTNYLEFLARTNPNDFLESPDLSIDISREDAAIAFEQIDQRAVQIEVSEDLIHWRTWDTENNGPHFPNGNAKSVEIRGPVDLGESKRQFFRVRVKEP